MLRLAMTTRAETFERAREPLAERGIEVVHVAVDERTVSLTADDSGTTDRDSPPENDEQFPDVDVGLVYPSRLMEGGVADAFLDVAWVNDREAVLTSRNKAGVYATLDQAGIAVPETTLVSNPVGERAVREAAAEIGFPVVVKPNSTTRGVGVAKLPDADSLAGVTDYLDLLHEFPATGDRSFLLQEYLPDARDYRVMIVDGRYAGAVERRLPPDGRAAGQWKHNVHRGAEAVAVDLPEPARRLAERTAAALGIDYLGVDLLRRNDRWLVNETNARPTIDDAAKYEPEFYDRLATLIRRRATEQ
jgi:ribosomal protein S6--L-glutamate ligase